MAIKRTPLPYNRPVPIDLSKSEPWEMGMVQITPGKGYLFQACGMEIWKDDQSGKESMAILAKVVDAPEGLKDQIGEIHSEPFTIDPNSDARNVLHGFLQKIAPEAANNKEMGAAVQGGGYMPYQQYIVGSVTAEVSQPTDGAIFKADIKLDRYKSKQDGEDRERSRFNLASVVLVDRAAPLKAALAQAGVQPQTAAQPQTAVPTGNNNPMNSALPPGVQPPQ